MGGNVSRLGNIFPDVAIKAPCLVATTGANIVLAGVQTVDGVTVGNNGERVLVKDQADKTANGIYQASTGNWTRTQDASKNTDFIDGTQVLVAGGSANINSSWRVTCADSPIALGTSLLTWSLTLFSVGTPSPNLFDTRTHAAAATIPTTTTFLYTSGYAVIGDGGGALYMHAIGSTTGGFQSADGQWWQLAAALLNVRSYGAKGDGVTDDSGAIQAALNVAAALGTPAAVYLPPGKYLCNTGLTMGGTNTANAQILLFGDDQAACTITAGASMTELLRIGPAAGSTTRLNRPEVRGIRFLDASHCSTAVVHFYNCIYGRFTRLRIENGLANGIQGDGNPNTTSTSGDPFTQGCFISEVSVRNCSSNGHYYRGVKGSVFTSLDADNNGNHGFHWDLENQTGGVNEITENVISNCLAKNGGNAGFAFSGIAKFNISNIEAYICAGPAVLFTPTGSGTSAPSFSSNISGLIVRNCAGGIVTDAGSGIEGLNVSNVNIAGDAGHPGPGIELRGWQRFTLSNVVMVGVPGNGIWLHDDASPPSGGGTQVGQGVISNIVLIGANQQSTQDGIVIDGTTSQVRIDGVFSQAAGGSAGYEFITLSATTEVELGNFYLVPNTSGHEISLTAGSVVQYFGLNRINTQPGTLWMPRVAASAVAAAGQLYEDSGNSNKLTWLDSSGTKRVINTTP